MGSTIHRSSTSVDKINLNLTTNISGKISSAPLGRRPRTPTITKSSGATYLSSQYTGQAMTRFNNDSNVRHEPNNTYYTALTNYLDLPVPVNSSFSDMSGAIEVSAFASHSGSIIGATWEIYDGNDILITSNSTRNSTYYSSGVDNISSSNFRDIIQGGNDATNGYGNINNTKETANIWHLLNNGAKIKVRMRHVMDTGTFSDFSNTLEYPINVSYTGSLSGYTPASLTTFATSASTFNNVFRSDKNMVGSYVTYTGNTSFHNGSTPFLDIYDATRYIATIGDPITGSNSGSGIFINSGFNFSTNTWCQLFCSTDSDNVFSKYWRVPVTATYIFHMVGTCSHYGGHGGYQPQSGHGGSAGAYATQSLSLNEGDYIFLHVGNPSQYDTYGGGYGWGASNSTQRTRSGVGGADTYIVDLNTTPFQQYRALGSPLSWKFASNGAAPRDWANSSFDGNSNNGPGRRAAASMAHGGTAVAGDNSTYGLGGVVGSSGTGFGAGSSAYPAWTLGGGGGGFGTDLQAQSHYTAPGSLAGCILIQKT